MCDSGFTSLVLGHLFPLVGAPVFAILLGMVVGNFHNNRTQTTDGIAFTSKYILQAAVVLLGFGLNLTQVFKVGTQSLPIIISTIAVSLVVAFLLQKWLKLDSNIAILVGVGSSICGGSAIAATAPVIKAKDEEVAKSISVIFLFNILAALIFPTLENYFTYLTKVLRFLREQLSMIRHPLRRPRQLGMLFTGQIP